MMNIWGYFKTPNASMAIFGYALIPKNADHSLSQNKGSTGVLDSLGNSYQWAMINSATLVRMKYNNWTLLVQFGKYASILDYF